MNMFGAPNTPSTIDINPLVESKFNIDTPFKIYKFFRQKLSYMWDDISNSSSIACMLENCFK
jgi:hypothetical protein